MSRRILVGVLALIFAAAMWAPAGADSNGGSVGWQYSEAGRGFYQAPQGGTSGPSDPVHRTEIYQPEWRCSAAECAPSGQYIWCNPDWTPEVRQPIYVRVDFVYAAADAGDRTKWQIVGGIPRCYPTPEFVPIEDVGYQFQYEIERRFRQPDIELRPNPETLVNLPTIVSTDYPSDKTFDITVPPSKGRTIPLTGTINAHADFTWSFEDGTTASGPGTPYDGTDPETNPDHYLTNTFRTAGHHTVSLTVTWTGSITVEGLPPEQFEPVTLTSTAGVDVVESHPVNTAP
jgi:hypothetical protein